MSLEDRFVGAKNALSFYYAFYNEIAKDIGPERAKMIGARVDETLGAAQGRIMKEHVGGNGLDINTATSMTLDALREGFGIRSEIKQKSADKIVFQCSRCPVYEAAQMVGMDNAAIETLCRTGSARFMDAMVKELNPRLSYRLENFRTTADAVCQEAIIME